MKLSSLILVCLLTIQWFAEPLFAKDPSSFHFIAENEASQESSENTIGQNDEQEKENNSLKPTQEERFQKRSQKTSKFLFSDLPRHLGYDLKESFWGWGSLAFALGIGATATLYTQDKQIEYSFAPHHLFGYAGDKVFNYAGAPYTMAGIGVITTAIGAGIHDLKLRTTGESILESLFWAELITIGAKYAFHRKRPDGSANGFPSAHTSGAFSTATVLQMMYGPKVGIPAYAFATVVALARVDSYNHFPSDVLMGAVLGSVVAYGTARFHKKLHGDFKVIPEVGMNHVGLSLNHEF